MEVKGNSFQGFWLCCLSKRHKLEDNSEKCIFVSYSIETKGYQFNNPLTKQLIVGRDVVWSESSAWNWKELQQCLGVITADEL